MTEKQTWTEDHDDLLNDVAMALVRLDAIREHLECANSCETLEDFQANVVSAVDDSDELLNDILRPLLKWAETFKV